MSETSSSTVRPPLRAGCAALATILCTGALAGPSHGSLEQLFTSPPKSERPWVRWWWPGGAVQGPELEREVAVLDASGFGGGEIQPFNPGIANLTPDERRAVNDYATPSFFEAVKQATDAAARHGLQIDYTFGSAWPSGGGLAITPELALVELTVSMRTVSASDPTPIKIELPARSKRLGAMSPLDPRTKDPQVADWKARLDARKRLVAIVAIKGTSPTIKPAAKNGAFKLFPFSAVVTQQGELVDGSQIVLTDRLRADGTLDWHPPDGEWQLLTFAEYASSASVMAGVGAGPQLVLDHFKEKALEAHAKRVADPLMEVLGPSHAGLRGTFVDSLELMQDLPWSEDFLSEFQKRRGYDLTPYLPLILQPGWMEAWDDHYSSAVYAMGTVGDRVRADYQQTVSDLLFERFVEPYVQWNRRHGTTSRFQAHGGPLDILKAYGAADIPETEDLFEFADPYFMKLARSAADLYGHSTVSAESFVWQGRPFSVTPAEIRQRADLLFASGVNQIVAHGFPYAFHEQNWPGWDPFAPGPFGPGFSNLFAETNPTWAAVPVLASYIARTEAVLHTGRPVVPVALYLGVVGYFKGIEDHGAGEHRVEKALQLAGYDFDRINPDALLSARMSGNRFVSTGGTEYQVLVVPPLENISVSAAERIAALAKQGLRVVFVDRQPTQAQGYFEPQQADARVLAALDSALRDGIRVAPLAELGRALTDKGVTPNLRFVGDATDVIFLQRDTSGRKVYFLHNSGASERDASFDTDARGFVERWNALDGTVSPQPATVSGTKTRVNLHLEGGTSALLVFDPSREARTYVPQSLRAVEKLTLPTTGWMLHVDGHAQGKVINQDLALETLADWGSMSQVGNFAGIGEYRHAFVAEPSWLNKRRRVVLYLGEAHDLATVTVNGHRFAPMWEPYRLDIGAYLKAGQNELSISIANVPNNALVGLRDPGYAALKPLPAGLLGPIQIESSLR